MKFNLTTYKTLKGKQEILELIHQKNTEAIIYQDNKPAYFVDCFDLQTEANVLMNSLVLSQRKTISFVIKAINKKNNIH